MISRNAYECDQRKQQPPRRKYVLFKGFPSHACGYQGQRYARRRRHSCDPVCPARPDRADVSSACLAGISYVIAGSKNLSPKFLIIVVLAAVFITLTAWAAIERRAEKSKPLKQRTIDLANELFEFRLKPKPSSPFSAKGEEERRQAFDAYFDWVKDTYFKYMAYYRDRVVQIDFELAAHHYFTKLERRDIDPPYKQRGGCAENRRSIATHGKSYARREVNPPSYPALRLPESYLFPWDNYPCGADV
jgi:hypothetical protein